MKVTAPVIKKAQGTPCTEEEVELTIAKGRKLVG